jgi:hypothetical protein
MKKYCWIAILLLALMAVKADPCFLQVKMLNQDPYPAIPGDYVKIVFEVTGIENPICNGASIKLLPEYPFSLDSDISTQSIKGGYIENYKTSWLVGYKLRIDKNALTGDYSINLLYQEGNKTDFSSAKQKTFKVRVEDVQTDFDVILQEQSGSTITLGIINIGKNAANSVIVRIPQQDNFRVTGTSEQIIGNLAPGDYTLVSFDVMPRRNITQFIENQLKIRIDYTDTLGERKMIMKDVGIFFQGNFTARNQLPKIQAKQTRFQWQYIVIALLSLAVVYLFKKNRKEKESAWIERVKKSEKK